MRKLLIAESIEESRAVLEKMFQNRCQVCSCGDGETAMKLLLEFEPDILVLDLMLPKTDGLSLLQSMQRLQKHPMVLVQTALVSPYVMDRLQRFGVDYVMIKPCRMQALESHINDFLAQMQTVMPIYPGENQFLRTELLKLGFSPKLDGYGHLIEAIPIYAKDPSQAITKELYAAVGENCNKEPYLVERSIRNAIDKAWWDGDRSTWQQYFDTGFNGTPARPTNGVFIARMAQLLADRTDLRLIAK